MNNIYCQQCKSPIDKNEINASNKIYHCKECDGFFKITTDQVKHGVKKSLKAKVPIPPNVKVTRNGQTVSVLVTPSKREKLKSIPLVFVLLFMLLCFIGVYSPIGKGMLSVVPLLIIGFILHLILSAFFQKGEVKINEEELCYRVRSYYSFGFNLKYKQATSNIAQVYVKSRRISSGDDNERTVYDLNLITKADEHTSIISNSTSSETLFYLEQLIEEELDIEDSIHPSEAPNINRIIPSASDIIKLIRNR